MRERSKRMNLEDLENYKPPEAKPRKRKAKQKKDEQDQDQERTIMLKLKTGEEVDSQSNVSDNRSTNPSSQTFSSKFSDTSERGIFHKINNPFRWT